MRRISAMEVLAAIRRGHAAGGVGPDVGVAVSVSRNTVREALDSPTPMPRKPLPPRPIAPLAQLLSAEPSWPARSGY